MLLIFAFIWLVSIAAAIAVGTSVGWPLILRLFFLAPLAGEITLLSLFGASGKPITLRMLADANTWFWAAVFFIYGVILFGPSAVALGGLGWTLIRAKELSRTVSKSTFMFLGTLAGAVVGGLFQILYGAALRLELPSSSVIWKNPWALAGMVAGAAGGFIVAHYAAKASADASVTSRHGAHI